ncbi:MAG: HAMP domain-containing histidine kinase [Chitinophagaceae bacterium]|nr:HAMP domain-containing histidine kinase [Chitinophagaceae bacterium]
MDLLHKINSFISIAQIWHLPLVLFIVVLCYRAVSVVHIKELSTIALGFSFNLAYIICDFLSARSSPFFPFVNIDNSFLVHLAIVCDLLTTLCFLLATISWFFGAGLRVSLSGATWGERSILEHSDKSRKLMVPAIFPFLAVLITSLTLDTSNIYLKIARSIYNFSGLSVVAYLFLRWESAHGAKKRISRGFFLWAILQWLAALSGSLGENVTQAIGFSVSLIAKFIIIEGMFAWYVSFALESAHQRDMEIIEKEQFAKSSAYFGSILANVFHELNLPLRSLGSSLERLHRYLARAGRVHLAEVENQFEQVFAILDVAKSSYTREGHVVVNPEDNDPGNRDTKIVRVNKLLAFAVRSVKDFYKTQIQVSLEYGSRCYIECIPSEIIQVFINLLKNAAESYPPGVQKRKIRVKSSLSKGGHTDFRQVVVEIEDFGQGIKEEVRETMWEAGVTTKKVDEYNAVRGRGLSVVKEFIEKTPGARIEILSPSQYPDTEEPFGSLFTISFPRREMSSSIHLSNPIT